MDELKNRLRSKMKERGMKTIREFANFCGIKEGTIGFYLKGERFPDSKSLFRIAVALGVSMEYLLTGESPPEANPDVTVNAKESPYFIAPIEGDIGKGPGRKRPKDFDDMIILHKNVKARSGPGRLVGLNVVGDSMEPVLSHGDLVLCNTGVADDLKHPRPGRLYCVKSEEEGGVVVRKVKYDARRKLLHLYPLNRDHDPLTVELRRGVKKPILGYVVGAWRSFDMNK